MSDFKPLSPKVVLGVAAHPDDLDFGASGTMAYFAANGADVYYLILTDGSKGSEDRSLSSEQLVKIRETEQKAAVKAIGGKGVEFLGFPDSGLENTQDLKKQIVKHIRKIKPDIVITMDPSLLYSADRGFINHPDHRAAGQATLDSVFPLARDHLTFPDLFDQGYEPHKTSTILLSNFENGNYIIDITSTIDKKIAALRSHKSQVDIDRIVPFITEMGAKIGSKAGYDLGEQFVRIDIK
jgi:LmbE family N-acetylglucosaminyl deacetylase